MAVLGGIRGLLIGLVALGAVCAPSAPVIAGEPFVCQVAKATAYHAAGDRYGAQHSFTEAARWYAAAARSTRDCPAANDSLLGARSLAQAGAALAQSGDEVHALAVLRAAQVRLSTLGSRDPRTAPAAGAFLDLVQRVISAIDDVARSSM